jgi:hypothetical protein
MTDNDEPKELGGQFAAIATQCPHCGANIAPKAFTSFLGHDPDGDWALREYTCPSVSCQRLVVELVQGKALFAGAFAAMQKGSTVMPARPHARYRPPLSADIPERYRKPTDAARAILSISPEASAALTRRTLQELLIEKGSVTKRDLFDQITEVIPSLPLDLRKEIDGVRAIGNFGAHPLKSTSTGDFMDVEEGEADWIISTLVDLLDFYFVQPAQRQRRIDAANAKLKQAGKPRIR